MGKRTCDDISARMIEIHYAKKKTKKNKKKQKKTKNQKTKKTHTNNNKKNNKRRMKQHTCGRTSNQVKRSGQEEDREDTMDRYQQGRHRDSNYQKQAGG